MNRNTVILGGLQDWQLEAARCISNEIADVLVLTGGFGSGKTAVNANIVRQFMETNKSTWLVIGTSKGQIKDTAKLAIEDEFPTGYITNEVLGPNYAWTIETTAGKSNIISRGMKYHHEAGSRLKSINARALWLVEATELPKEAYTIGISRLRDSGEEAYYPVIIETNPKSKSNWVYETFIKGAKEVYKSDDGNWRVEKKTTKVENNDGTDRDLRIIIFHTTTHANKHYPRHIISQMKESYSPSEYNRLVLGEWNSTDGRVWDTYHVFKHPFEDMKGYASGYDRVFVGIDPANNHDGAMVFIGQRGPDYYEVFDEIVEPIKSVAEWYKKFLLIKESWGILDRTFNVWVDPAALWFKKEWNVIPNNPNYAYSSTHKGTDPAWNRAMRMGELMRTQRLKISTHCKRVIRDIENTESKGRDKQTIDKDSHDPHAMDAVGYAAMKEIF